MFKEASPSNRGCFPTASAKGSERLTPSLPVVELDAAAQPLGWSGVGWVTHCESPRGASQVWEEPLRFEIICIFFPLPVCLPVVVQGLSWVWLCGVSDIFIVSIWQMKLLIFLSRHAVFLWKNSAQPPLQEAKFKVILLRRELKPSKGLLSNCFCFMTWHLGGSQELENTVLSQWNWSDEEFWSVRSWLQADFFAVGWKLWLCVLETATDRWWDVCHGAFSREWHVACGMKMLFWVVISQSLVKKAGLFTWSSK